MLTDSEADLYREVRCKPRPSRGLVFPGVGGDQPHFFNHGPTGWASVVRRTTQGSSVGNYCLTPDPTSGVTILDAVLICRPEAAEPALGQAVWSGYCASPL